VPAEVLDKDLPVQVGMGGEDLGYGLLEGPARLGAAFGED